MRRINGCGFTLGCLGLLLAVFPTVGQTETGSESGKTDAAARRDSGSGKRGGEQPSFYDGTFRLGQGPNAGVFAVALQEDSKILVVGQFTQFDYGDGFFTSVRVQRGRIARLNPDGSMDAGFDPGSGANNDIYAVALQSDGQILIGGSFTNVEGLTQRYLARLSPDGTLDGSFAPAINDELRGIAVQPDGSILIAGRFTSVDGEPRGRIARLTPEGMVDTGFQTGIGANGRVRCLALQPDGKILIGGEFTQVDGVTRNRVARLLADGSLDVGFDPGSGVSALVRALALQADGKVLVGGEFLQVNGTNRNRIARLNSNGSLDLDFDPGSGANDIVRTIAVQADGKILLGGQFSVVNGQSRARLARLMSSGALDPQFPARDQLNGALADEVFALAVQPDGRVVVGGQFPSVGNYTPARLLRVYGDTDTPSFVLAAASYEAAENAGTLPVIVRRLGDSTGTLSVDYAAVPRPGIFGRGQIPTNGTLTFAPLETTKTISVPVMDDAIFFSPDELPDAFLNVLLTNATGGAGLGLPCEAVVAIPENDAPFQFESASYLTNELAGFVLLSVMRDTAEGSPASVDFYTEDGTALAGLNYTATNGTLHFGKNESTKQIAVGLLPDLVIRGTQTFHVNLTNPVGVGLGMPRRAEVQVKDASGTISVAPQVWVDENAGLACVGIKRTGQAFGTVTVAYSITEGTALAGLDFIPSSGTLTFTNGQTNQCVLVPIVNDGVEEPAESFYVSISNPSLGATLALPTKCGVTIQDNDHGVSFNQEIFFASERARQAVLRLRREDDGTNKLTVRYHTLEFSALPGFDYVDMPSGEVTLNPKETNALLIVPLVADTWPEPTKAFFVVLDGASPDGSLGDVRQAYVHIMDGSSPAAMDGSFEAHIEPFTSGIQGLALMADGRLAVSQLFDGIQRLLGDGQRDPTFRPETMPNNGYYGLAVQSDGKVLWTSTAYMPDGAVGARSLRRMSMDGACDPTFAEGCDWFATQFWTAAGKVVAVQSDGRILLGGDLGKEPASYGLSRHEPDGQVDPTFQRILPKGVRALALLPDGRILVGGENLLVRLQPNGALDTSFQATLAITSGEKPPSINALALQPDGNLVVAGWFHQVNGAIHNHIVRLTPTGQVDPSWRAEAGTDEEVRALALQGNGRIVLGGSFTQVNGESRRRIARLEKDGGLDSSFAPDTGAEAPVNALVVQPDGRILVGGEFLFYEGQLVEHLVRLMGDTVPRVLSAQMQGTEFHLTAACDPGMRLELQGSLDFLKWTSLQTNEAGSDRLEMKDAKASEHPFRFYRLLQSSP